MFRTFSSSYCPCKQGRMRRMEQDLSLYRKTKFLKYILFSHYKIQQTTTFFRKYLLIPISLNSDYSFGKLELVLAFWIWILACLLGCWGGFLQRNTVEFPLPLLIWLPGVTLNGFNFKISKILELFRRRAICEGFYFSIRPIWKGLMQIRLLRVHLGIILAYKIFDTFEIFFRTFVRLKNS